MTLNTRKELGNGEIAHWCPKLYGQGCGPRAQVNDHNQACLSVQNQLRVSASKLTYSITLILVQFIHQHEGSRVFWALEMVYFLIVVSDAGRLTAAPLRPPHSPQASMRINLDSSISRGATAL